MPNPGMFYSKSDSEICNLMGEGSNRSISALEDPSYDLKKRYSPQAKETGVVAMKVHIIEDNNLNLKSKDNDDLTDHKIFLSVFDEALSNCRKGQENVQSGEEYGSSWKKSCRKWDFDNSVPNIIPANKRMSPFQYIDIDIDMMESKSPFEMPTLQGLITVTSSSSFSNNRSTLKRSFTSSALCIY
mmetsp:Transcript_11467/g.15791  ORF Transcript_11467/g.15791 Transcript_11467/m.15791 type:complete len:186 (-) Transcript_11467:312-869(-)